MKIGMLTHPLIENYGGMLQAAALYGYLESQGHEVTLLRKHRYRPAWKNAALTALEKIPFQNIRNYRFLAKKRDRLAEFIKLEFPKKTDIVFTLEDLKEINSREKFDALIVGSDQVWRMSSIDDGHYEAYFLGFADSDEVIKFSYAASFGVDRWESPEKIDKAAALLSEFKAVSVRESSGIDICKYTLGCKRAVLTLDPTLLVEREFYNGYIEKSGVIKRDGLAVYLLDKAGAKENIVKIVCEAVSRNEPYVDLNSRESIKTTYEWVGEMEASRFVVTDSFHGMVFAILFNKDFIVIGNKKRGLARFLSLLDMLGLQSRLVDESVDSQSLREVALKEINYEDVNGRLASLRFSSKEFIESALGKSAF